MKPDFAQLSGFGLVVCELAGPNYLSVRLAIDLSLARIEHGNHFGLITNDNLPSIIPKFPSPPSWRIFGQYDTTNWLEVKDGNLLAFFLTYNPQYKLFDIFKIEGKQKSVQLLNERLGFIQTSVYDFAIIRKSNAAKECGLVENVMKQVLEPAINVLEYFMPEHTATPGFDQSLSLSKCATSNRYELQDWKHSLQTPNDWNKCQDSQKYVDEDFDDDPMDINTNDLENPTCPSVSRDAEALNKEIEEYLANVNTCTSQDMNTQRLSEIALEAERMNQRKKKVIEDDNFEDRRYKLGAEFQDSWLHLITTYQKDLIPLKQFSNQRDWIEYLENPGDKRKSTYRCKICYNMGKISFLKPYEISELGLESGTLKRSLELNRKMISRHAKTRGHKRFVQDLMQLYTNEAPDDIIEKIEQKILDNPLHSSTVKTLTAVYYEVRLGLSTYAHASVMELLRRFKVIEGENYCVERRMARRIIVTMAGSMTERLRKYLQSSTMPAVLTLDG